MKSKQKVDQTISPEDADLKELIEWMVDNYTIREMLKRIIASREKEATDWLNKELKEIGGFSEPPTSKGRF